ncbi:vanadium-dependent haloperoxidase [Rhodoplanes roseus]|nr:vanadium-dependent haloperoxidase [Rhodoplanes roseus]
MPMLPKVEEEAGLNAYPVLYWNHVALEMNRITHSLGGPQTGPTMSSRALGLLHLAMHDAYFIALGHNQTSNPPTYLATTDVTSVLDRTSKNYTGHRDGPSNPVVPGNLANANLALTGAAVTILDLLYGRQSPNISVVASDTLRSALRRMIGDHGPYIDTLHPAHGLGVTVARAVFDLLGVKPDEPGADQGRYEPRQGRYCFRDEPVTPVRPAPIDPNDPSRGTTAARIYHGPFYGSTVKRFAVHDDAGHRLEKWPEPAAPGAPGEYQNALQEVVHLGGAPGLPKTHRDPDQTVAAYYWAYDGANLIGTPPRLYNQIIRTIAWSKKLPDGDELARTSDFVRLFALANTAMADAGKYAWLEKYRFELWRPLSGIREHDPSTGPDAVAGTGPEPIAEPHLSAEGADPFWYALGAPETNTDKVSFKPPFPAYPSGHATFGAAAFQMVRLYYRQRAGSLPSDPADWQAPDDITFTFVSEELNGISRDLRQPYDPSKPIEDQQGVVRTRVRRRFVSLWNAIFENALSRIYLGVHWRFDAADYGDMTNGSGGYKSPSDMRFSHVWTGPRGPQAKYPTGGIPLGLGIANDIFHNGMKSPHGEMTADRIATSSSAAGSAKMTNTNIR